MEPVYQIYHQEIGATGRGYLALRRCRREDVDEALDKGREQLLAMGATEIYVTSSDPAAPLEEGERAGCRLTHVRDLLWMERGLGDIPPQGEAVTLERLTRSRGGAWLTLHNQCCFDLPNAQTYGPQALERALDGDHLCGFVRWAELCVGVYELTLTGELPELTGLAVLRDFRGRGLGRAALHALLGVLAGLGYTRCRLLSATDNTPAFTLFRSAGFRAAGIQGQWFSMQAV